MTKESEEQVDEEFDDGKTPFQRFEEFARKIAAVPKHEVDELLKSKKKG